jgi:hypothetical protein
MSFLGLALTARTVRLLAMSYALKTLLVVAVWVMAPHIPARAIAEVRAAWARLATAVAAPEDSPEAPVSAP